MNKKIAVRNSPNRKLHYFDNTFDAMQFQRETAWGRGWLHTPMIIKAYPYLREKGKKNA
jgi:hypothetical protein